MGTTNKTSLVGAADNPTDPETQIILKYLDEYIDVTMMRFCYMKPLKIFFNIVTFYSIETESTMYSPRFHLVTMIH